MDKRYVRSITTKDIDELKKQIEDENNNMDDDFKDLESSRFMNQEIFVTIMME